jgi:enterochelin esterase-like enzyme
MKTQRSFWLLLAIMCGVLLAAACEPLVPTPTPQVIVITATPSPGPTITATLTLTPTSSVTDTPTPTASPTTPACVETAGQVIVFDTFESAIAGRNMPYRVYVPLCYFQTQRRYPVVYLIHGASNDDTHFQDIGLPETLDRGLELGIYPPMIVVMPYGAQLLPNDDFPPDPSMETFMLDELIPRIEQDLCVWEDRQHRAIGGISRGGFWALSIAMRHPEEFGAVGGHSAALDTDITPDAFNPIDLALNAPFLDTLRIYLDNAAGDPVRPEVEQLSNNLVQRQIPHQYVINPLGNHDDAYWAAHMADYLTFYADDWPRDADALPSCLEPSP